MDFLKSSMYLLSIPLLFIRIGSHTEIYRRYKVGARLRNDSFKKRLGSPVFLCQNLPCSGETVLSLTPLKDLSSKPISGVVSDESVGGRGVS